MAGLEGEFCVVDTDCDDPMICERRVCMVVQQPLRESLFFAVLRLEDWLGPPESGQLQQYGQFVSDLSTELFPYYGAEAPSENWLLFGMVDPSLQLWELSEEQTVTEVAMSSYLGQYIIEDVDLMIPVVYSDANVQIDFEMPLVDSVLEIELDNTEIGTIGEVWLEGALRAVDAETLWVTSGDETFTVFDVLRVDPLDADTNGDGIEDAWTMTWMGTAELY